MGWLHFAGRNADVHSVDPALAVLAAAATASACTTVALVRTLSRAQRGSAADRETLVRLVDTAKTQAEAAQSQSRAMIALSEMSAESIRLATGSFVFELRDRFDAALSGMSLGVAGCRWSARLAGEEVPVEHVVFHGEDRARIELTLALSQAAERRVVSMGWTNLPTGAHPGTVEFTGQGGSPRVANAPIDHAFEAAPDVPLFIDAVLELDLFAALAGVGATVAFMTPSVRLVQEARAEINTTDLRPEGVVASRAVIVTFSATATSCEDGVAIDAVSVHAEIGPERRTYLLVKDERLELAFPTLSRPSLA